MKKLLLLAALAAASSACSSVSRVDFVGPRVLDWSNGDRLYVVKDPDTGVTCYAYSRGGLQCALEK